jgi:hypothetical protein
VREGHCGRTQSLVALLQQVSCFSTRPATTRSLSGVGVAGASDGVASGALFNAPTGVAYAPAGTPAATGTLLANGGGSRGTLWVADTGNHRLRRVDVATGVVETLAGVGLPGLADGDAAVAAFQSPQGVAVTAGGTVYIAGTSREWAGCGATLSSALCVILPTCALSAVSFQLTADSLLTQIPGTGAYAPFGPPMPALAARARWRRWPASSPPPSTKTARNRCLCGHAAWRGMRPGSCCTLRTDTPSERCEASRRACDNKWVMPLTHPCCGAVLCRR